VKVAGVIMRAYSYLFHFLLALFLIALALVTWSGGVHNLKLRMLPWEGATLTYSVLVMGLAGVAATILAYKGILRPVFFIWSLFVLAMMIKGYIFSAYIFAGAAEWFRVLAFILAAAVAAAGAWSAWKEQPANR